MKRMKELVAVLRDAADSYYNKNIEKISNFQYDKLYDELESLEKKYGVVLAGSPTIQVGYEVMDMLPKEAHETRMLSLDKTKDMEALKVWLGDKKGILSWKLDGLTVVLTYENGKLLKAVTRGNGDVGEIITSNAKTFINLPLTIPYMDKIIVRGEAVISYSDFELINDEIENIEAKYKNPRNLCSGSVRQLNSAITAKRKVRFYAFYLSDIDSQSINSRQEKMDFLKSCGFEIVDYRMVTAENIVSVVSDFAGEIENMDLPSDGLVLSYDDIKYGKSLGETSKFPRDSIAFKWEDEIKETILKEIEWSASRTGLINPVAIFEPVELEGTTVSRASVHNLSILKELQLGIGDKICVYKANMIIPQIAENITKSGNVEIPSYCPVCGEKAIIKSEGMAETLNCINPKCFAKQIKTFTLFVSRDALNIAGLSEATLEKFISKGFVRQFADIFRLERYKDEIVVMEGFGEKSFKKIITAVDKSRKTNVVRLLYSLGISGIGLANAKVIAKHCNGQWEKMQNLTEDELLGIDGIGGIMATNYRKYFEDDENLRSVRELLKELQLEDIEVVEDGLLSEKIFVITGALVEFKNRKELQNIIEKNGGKVASSVSSNTSYLINNDHTSSSSKNKKAKELGVKIITEEEFMELLK